jgi:hypothetical protein
MTEVVGLTSTVRRSSPVTEDHSRTVCIHMRTLGYTDIIYRPTFCRVNNGNVNTANTVNTVFFYPGTVRQRQAHSQDFA